MSKDHVDFDPAAFGAAGFAAGGMIGGALAAGISDYRARCQRHRERVAEAEQAGLFLSASEAFRRRDYEARIQAEKRAAEAELALARFTADAARRAVNAHKQAR